MNKKKVQVVITTQDQEILLLKMLPKRGGHWQNVTGSVDAGEDYIQAALRESMEETGIKEEQILELTPLGINFNFIDQYGSSVAEECFKLIAKEKWEIEMDEKEHQQFLWKNINDITDKDVFYASSFSAILKSRKI